MDSQLTKENIASKLISIISNALRIDESKITRDSRIVNDLNAESLDILDIRYSIEQELGLEIGENEIADTIGNGISYSEYLNKFTVSNLTDFLVNKTYSRETENETD